MDDKLFDELLASVEQMDSIIKKEAKPSREFNFAAPEVKDIREKTTSDGEVKGLDIIFRNFHTLKGNSRIFGFSFLPPLIHELEDKVINIMKENKDGNLNINNIKFRIS